MDYADVQLIARLADNPELVVDDDKVWLTSYQTETDGYAREDDRWIIAPGDTAWLDFDAFKDSDWIDLAVKNEGASSVNVALLDDNAVRFTTLLEAGRAILLRCYKWWAKPGDGPFLYSAGGTSVRVFAWGLPFEGQPV
jgi:hypothetical protein